MIFAANKRPHSGFSLVELLVSIGLFSVLFLLGAFSSYKDSTGRVLRQSAKDLISTIENYQEIAARSGADISLLFLVGGNTATISTPSKLSSSPAQTQTNYHLPPNVRVTFANFGTLGNPTTLSIRPTSITPGKIILSHNNGQLCSITISLRGAKRWEC